MYLHARGDLPNNTNIPGEGRLEASIIFSIFPEGADPEVDPPVMDIRGKNDGGRAKVTWCARDIRKPEDEGAMKWFFTAWTLYCPKETSGTMRVLNPQVKDVSIDKKVIFIGQILTIPVNSFEPNNQSYTIDFYKVNKITKEMTTLYSENFTMDSEECEIEIPIEVNEEIKKDITEINIRIGRDDNYEYHHPEKISLISKPLFT